ncbi:ABC transporter substrate-binding protein [Hansschlegelia plantiphila]|uniref:ABC transporter substrate-binding protein n=1 Tax=Hansschlegelia plantiphila TaxID=374655 RepID=A0A9W6J5W4_9HYPH|nr:extracellular solute-binding protein [Hansschlegelia plantiphila]GLK69878.1 ABC transporter substrate-binding protein [Hansschlegelia plantiphila]
MTDVKDLLPFGTANILNNDVLSRRSFMGSALALGAGAALGSFTGFSPAKAAVGGDLKIMAWEGFTLENELKAWREKNGVQVDAAIISTQDDVHSKFIGGGAVRLDLAEYSQGFERFYVDELKIVKPIDIAKVPNFTPENIQPQFYQAPTWYFEGEYHAIPWVWGLNALVYNPKMTKPIKSYKDLLAPEMKGKLTFCDDTIATWPMIARLAGFGPKFPNLTKDEMKTAFEGLGPYRDQCRVFASSNGDTISLFASGEIAACFSVWSGTPVETAKRGVETVYAVPEEGAVMWCDAWFMPKTSVNTDTAHAFMNQAISPEVQAAVCKAVTGGSVNKHAPALMDADTKALFNYADLPEVFRKSPLQGQPPRTSDKYATYDEWTQAWADFKSSF